MAANIAKKLQYLYDAKMENQKLEVEISQKHAKSIFIPDFLFD